MILKKDIFVINPKKEEWGIGKVIDGVGNNVYEVFFTKGGFRKFDKKNNPLVESTEQFSDEIFEHLNRNSVESFTTVSDLQTYFLANYENGFEGQTYKDRERDYKDKAHNLIVELLEFDVFKDLIECNNYDEIVKRTLKVVNSTNLIFPNEKMALKDGLNTDELKEKFSQILFDVLFNRDDEQSNFEKFIYFLESINADKWTIASYFQFFMYPNEYIFIKPSITQKIAEISAYDIEYTPQLNWNTFSKVQQFSKYFRKNIESLHPKDMIDVQSFIWCVSEK